MMFKQRPSFLEGLHKLKNLFAFTATYRLHNEQNEITLIPLATHMSSIAPTESTLMLDTFDFAFGENKECTALGLRKSSAIDEFASFTHIAKFKHAAVNHDGWKGRPCNIFSSGFTRPYLFDLSYLRSRHQGGNPHSLPPNFSPGH